MAGGTGTVVVEDTNGRQASRNYYRRHNPTRLADVLSTPKCYLKQQQRTG
ncbi:MAG: hypothetical protein IPN94_25575 [Sphingobacteriales bacterium]|nr:hypothetical protein [Sphingobacteriales bacterium]